MPKVNILHDGNAVGSASCGFFLRGPDYKYWGEFAYQYFEPWIYEKYYGFRHWYGDDFSQTPEYNKAHVTVHRTVRNLEQKDLITIKRAIFNTRNWCITDKGVELLKMHRPDLFEV